jgi:beta-lactamase class D
MVPFLFVVFLSLVSCSSKNIVMREKDPFAGMKGCFLLYNLKTEKFEKKLGSTCEERVTACSTFKVPLSVMAFDSGVLKSEKEVYPWDGQNRMLPEWNQDQTAETWMKYSVVWFSQRLTPKIGKKKLQKYLDDFDYGNKNLSAGLTSAWLKSPKDSAHALSISPYEQVEFLKKLWRDKLPVSGSSMEVTRKLTYLDTSPKGFKLHGKTGSNFYDEARKIQLGWFISHIQKGDQEYIAVTNLSDLKPVETKLFGGQRAKALTLELLKREGLW